MFANPFLAKLEDSRNILIAGCGGGYDFMSGVPLYEYLTSIGKNCTMANLCFTGCSNTTEKSTPRLCKHLYEVTKDSEGIRGYFPEKYLCEYYHKEFEKDLTIYCFSKTFGFGNVINVKELELCYTTLCEKLNIDTIIISDGGNDSLMRGDEESVGTVVEDMTSISAVYRVKNVASDKKFMLSLGFGIDFFHGCHATHVLENIANVIKTTDGGYLGCFSMVKESKEYKLFRSAFEYVNKRNSMISIVGSSIISATDGEFGNFHATERTKRSELYINPLMSIYWCFDNQKLAKQIHFIQRIIDEDNENAWDVGGELQRYRQKVEKEKKIREKGKYPH